LALYVGLLIVLMLPTTTNFPPAQQNTSGKMTNDWSDKIMGV
jgi:hypothetical protein